ncbi:MAG TPA: LCP family protein [Clostridia bacterium]|nr:LCP family protein [Clostridia bacterium]
MSLEAFKELVDAIGGVEFYVPQDMKKKDQDPRLNIDLKQGHQRLDGDKALQLVRFRGYPNADIGRIETQQRFLLALADQLLTVANVPKLPQLVSIFAERVETDLSFRDLQWFARKVMDLDAETDITVATLPIAGFGNYQGHNYVYLAKDNLLELINQTINPFKYPITAGDISIIRLQDNRSG